MKKDTIELLFATSIWLILFAALAIDSLAVDECGFSIPEDTTCSLVSPFISFCGAYTLDIYFADGTALISSGVMSQIGTTGIYNYTATFNVSDVYVIKLCDDSVRSLTVINTSQISPSGSFWSYLLQIYYNTLPGAW